MGVQAPARRVYCTNFIEAVERVKEDPDTGWSPIVFNGLYIVGVKGER